ncbi:VanZ family protein [Nitrosovibrio tenuis]|uniref:VanZ like family protein n=1 Tax=Nitrosovibrio tenuis TaxID=1233 RepID=A0A1H7G213_9PROT|nr:VanZ family protein [Nitrosovibrio tenuis]SEK30822.1 VanZ like family protein [Nitrosovibrio tenuis]
MRILLVIALLIAYGSLYPGDFSSSGKGAVTNFLTDWRWFTSLGDVLGNIALFIPLGLASIFFASARPNASARIVWPLFLAFVYSFALQLAQVWLPSRSAALADVAWNMAGMTFGMAVAHLIEKRRVDTRRPFDSMLIIPQLILILWLINELFPLVPSLDLQKFRDALKPFFLGFNFSFPEAFMHAAAAVAAGSAFIALGRRPAWWLGGLLILILAGKLAILNLVLDASVVIGLAAGYAGCLAALRLGGTKIFHAAFWSLLAAWTIISITPFVPARDGILNAIPFATMLRGSLEGATQQLTQSLFIYTALLWLAQMTGIGIRKATAGLIIWSCLIELVQMGFLGRTADVTEPILVLLISWVLSVSKQSHPKQTALEPEGPIPQPYIVAIPAEISGRRTLGLLAMGIAICALIGWLIVQSALIPYNVRELVYEGHPFRSLILLAALLYWSIGFPVLIAQWLTRGNIYLLSLPALVLLHGLVAWVLLRSAVPDESIHDIVGSPVLAWPRDFELLGRFLALFSFWSVATTAGSLTAAWHILPGAKSALLGWAIGACLLIPISYYVVVTAASTDNLVELIANNGSLSSFLIIGLAVAEISFGGSKGALALIPGAPWRKSAAAWVLAMGVLAYVALYFGTEQVIIKYNQIFSALQFLLSSDRSHLAQPNELIIRYMALYGFVVAAIVVVQNPLWRWVMSPRRG